MQDTDASPLSSGGAAAVTAATEERLLVRMDRGLAELYLIGSLTWSAMRWAERPELLELAMECYRYLSSRSYEHGARGFNHLPLFIILDLLVIVELGERAPFASETLAHTWSGPARRARIDYENQLFGALLQERTFLEARERLPTDPRVRRGATQRLVELLLQTFGRHFPRWFQVDPAHLRNMVFPQTSELATDLKLATFEERVDAPGVMREALAELLRGISNHVYWKDLFQEEDLFEIEHWALLDSEATRIGARQISEVERRLNEFRLPRVSLNREAMEVETDFIDDTTYPTGGFSGLTNRGSFENLVRSELVYMGEGDEQGVSLFDLRFAENELLFYLRHDGTMRRKRRFVHIVLELDVAFSYKSPGYDYPFATLVQGLVTRLTRDLLAVFEEDAITVAIHYLYAGAAPSEGDVTAALSEEGEHARRERERVEREVSLVALVLSREVRQERVSITLTQKLDPTLLQERRGRVYALAFCFNRSAEARWRATLKELAHGRPPVVGVVLPIAQEEPSAATLEEPSPLFLPLSGATMGQVAEIKNELFARILGGRR